MTEFLFPNIPIPERQSKPRKRGLTMMIDWGLPLGLQKDCLEAQGLYVDEAKIAASGQDCGQHSAGHAQDIPEKENERLS